MRVKWRKKTTAACRPGRRRLATVGVVAAAWGEELDPGEKKAVVKCRHCRVGSRLVGGVAERVGCVAEVDVRPRLPVGRRVIVAAPLPGGPGGGLPLVVEAALAGDVWQGVEVVFVLPVAAVVRVQAESVWPVGVLPVEVVEAPVSAGTFGLALAGAGRLVFGLRGAVSPVVVGDTGVVVRGPACDVQSGQARGIAYCPRAGGDLPVPVPPAGDLPGLVLRGAVPPAGAVGPPAGGPVVGFEGEVTALVG